MISQLENPDTLLEAAQLTNPLATIPAPLGSSILTRIGDASANGTTDKPRHRWYFFKEAFSPEIVSCAAEDVGVSGNEVIFDPFCGSGTVTLQAALLGRKASGIEVNPFLAFVAKTKFVRCKAAAFEAVAEGSLRSIERGRASPLERFSTFSMEGENSGKWLFNPPVLRAFEGGWHSLRLSHSPAANLTRLCLLVAAMDVCNATRDGKCLRYRNDWQEQQFGKGDFAWAFMSRVAEIAEDLRSTPLADNLASVSCGDSRTRLAPSHFKLCVTSPPYLNSFDYTDVYRPELFLGKWITEMGALRQLRHKTIRSHVQVNWKLPTENDFGAHYNDLVNQIEPIKEALWDRRIPSMIQAYFQDIQAVLQNLKQKAESTATVWLVVSTSAYGGVEIPVDLIIADIACRTGWYLREVSVLRHLTRVAGQQWAGLSDKKVNGPHLRESVVILDTQPRR